MSKYIVFGGKKGKGRVLSRHRTYGKAKQSWNRFKKKGYRVTFHRKGSHVYNPSSRRQAYRKGEY